MFKDREFVVRMNKADKGTEAEDPRNDVIFEDRVSLTHAIIKDTVKKVFVVICVYVVLDTARQVLVARNTDIRVYD